MPENSGKMNWQPTKGSVVWTGLGAAVRTMVVGFTWGGWTTAGSAQEQAADAAEAARA